MSTCCRISNATERRIGLADDRVHGRDGDLPVTDMDWFHPVCDAFMEGAQELGIPRCEDYNSGDRQAGVGYFQRLINRGYRHSAARVFLHPARRGGQSGGADRRARVAHPVRRHSCERRALCRRPGSRDVRSRCCARREVIVSAGTANTAKLLQISGVGPASLWRDLGVPVVPDLPVGENFRDHYSARIVARVKNIRTINEMSKGIGLAGQIARWALGKPSILAVSPSLVHWFWKSEDTMQQPDLQGVFSPGELQARLCGTARRLSRNDRRRLAAPAGKHRLRARPLHRSVRGSGDPAELPEGPDGPARAAERHEAGRANCCTRRRSRRFSIATNCPARACSPTTSGWTYARRIRIDDRII